MSAPVDVFDLDIKITDVAVPEIGIHMNTGSDVFECTTGCNTCGSGPKCDYRKPKTTEFGCD